MSQQANNSQQRAPLSQYRRGQAKKQARTLTTCVRCKHAGPRRIGRYIHDWWVTDEDDEEEEESPTLHFTCFVCDQPNVQPLSPDVCTILKKTWNKAFVRVISPHLAEHLSSSDTGLEQAAVLAERLSREIPVERRAHWWLIMAKGWRVRERIFMATRDKMSEKENYPGYEAVWATMEELFLHFKQYAQVKLKDPTAVPSTRDVFQRITPAPQLMRPECCHDF